MASISRVVGNQRWARAAQLLGGSRALLSGAVLASSAVLANAAALLVSRDALAQVPPPPPAAPPPPPPAAAPASGEEVNGSASEDALDANPELHNAKRSKSSIDKPKKGSATGETQGAATSDSAAEASDSRDETEDEASDTAAADAEGAETEDESEGVLSPADQLRAARNRASVNLQGSTGLLRTHYAGSGPQGTFRFGLLGSYFSSERFLCPQCEAPDGGPAAESDQVRRVEAHVMLGVTPLPFLEVYGAIHSSATSNTRGTPTLLQVLGDSSWGVKGFMPYEENRVFSAGAALEAWLLNGAGSVGIAGSSIAIRALGSADFSNRSNAAERFPLRVNLNLSYIFDNSAGLVADIEKQRNHPISRIERFGLNINRVDRFDLALGVEGLFAVAHPFIEFSLDVPVNRQGYECAPRKLGASDVCLSQHEVFSAFPSRLSLGGRAYGPIDGLSFTGALDIGLGGVNAPFWDETQPEMPWNLWLGLAYAADSKPRLIVKTVPAGEKAVVPAGTQPTARGVVVDNATGAGIAGATLLFEGRSLTGMVSNTQGEFVTPPMEPGKYTLAVTHEDYDAASCILTVEPVGGAKAVTGEGATTKLGTETSATSSEAASADNAEAKLVTPDQSGAKDKSGTRCELKAKPRVGNIEGTIVDADSLRPLIRAHVTVTDGLGRSLGLEVDDRGAFRFENVPPGQVTLRVEADKHLPTAAVASVLSRKDVDIQIPAHAVPAVSNATLAPDQIRLKRGIRFADGSADLLPESRVLLDEVAALLSAHPEVSAVEIRVHAVTGTGKADGNAALSNLRANTLRSDLVARGVESNRLRANGVGDSKRLTPDNSDAGRQRNERVELFISK